MCTYDVYELGQSDAHLDDQFVGAVTDGPNQFVVGPLQQVVVQSLSVIVPSHKYH